MTSDARPGSVVGLTDDEAKALVWAARQGSAKLRAEGWEDLARNADILDAACAKVEAAHGATHVA